MAINSNKKELIVFFLIDASESMSGKKIGTLNTTMEELLSELRNLEGATTDIKIAVMTFSDGCKWITEEPISVDDYQCWTRIKAGGDVDLGEAFKELSRKLSKDGFYKKDISSSYYAPVIFLFSNAYPTDNAREALNYLKKNKLYKKALKCALGIGDRFDEQLLKQFTENPELVFTSKSSDQLAKLIKPITLSEEDFNEEGGLEMALDLHKDREITGDEFTDLDFDPLEVKPISKKNLVVFFLVDTSGSMYGKKIGTLNTTMEELLPELRGLGGATTDIKLAVMTFSDGCKWITEEPMSVDDYQYWTRLKAEGLTDLGEAFEELSRKLSRKEFLNSPSLSYAPVIFLLTDGYATDDAIGGLEKLQHNNWYKYGLKVALGIGDKFDEELLKRFTGNPELVVTAKTSDQLAKLVKTIAVTSSQIGSRSMTLTSGEDGKEITEEDVLGTKEKELAETIKETMENDEAFVEDFDVEDGWDD